MMIIVRADFRSKSKYGRTVDEFEIVVFSTNTNCVCEQVAFVPRNLDIVKMKVTNQLSHELNILHHSYTHRFVWELEANHFGKISRHLDVVFD